MLDQFIHNDYLRAFAVLVLSLLLIRLALFFLEKFAIRIASKTKTKADDELFARGSKPMHILTLLIGLLLGIKELSLTPEVDSIVNNLIYSVIVVIAGYLIYIIIDVLVIKALKRITKKTKSDIDDSLVSLFHSVLKIALVIISTLYILGIWGVEITPLLAGLGIAGLAVALALQPILSNIFSGAAMVLDHSIRVHDLVYLDERTKGRIEKIGLRSTKIKTFDNELLIIPNNKLADSTIQNVALPEPKSRAVVPFSVAYGSDVDKVKKVILQEIKKIQHVEKDPEPLVRFIEMADSSLNFKVYFYVDSFENRFAAIDEANTRIYKVLNRERIEIPFPQMDVHVKKK